RVARRPLLLFELVDTRFELARAFMQNRAELRRLPAKLLLGDLLQPRVLLVDLVDDRLNLLALALMARADHRVDDSLEHSNPLTVQPLRRDEVGDGLGDEPSNRFSFANPLPDLRRRDIDATRCQELRLTWNGRQIGRFVAALRPHPLHHYEGRK